MKVLLLNPPGSKIYTRDYYCSKVSKSDYIYHPVDLLILSGILVREHEIFVIDAIADKLTPDECASKILKEDYGAIIFLTGSVSWDEDSEFISSLKKKKEFLAVGTGDILLEDCASLMRENNFLDAVILDFTTDDILFYLGGEHDKVKNMTFRKGGEIIDNGAVREFQKEFEIPVPKYELFPNKKYNYPFVLRHPFATVLTDYGCPFKCKFCVMNTIGFKYRKLENVFKELRYIKKLGFKDIYFDDQTFGAKRERLEAICDFMVNNKLNMGWVCWSRVDVVDEDLLKLMKKAGCHTILFGVESGNEEILKKNYKGFTISQVKKIFALCRNLKIRTLGTFIFGLPGETRESCLKTIDLAKEIKADFVSFNVLIPRMNTEIRKESIEKGFVKNDIKIMDQSGSFAVMGNEEMSSDEIMALKKKAEKDFYLRPSYVLRRLVLIRTPYELKLMFLNGWGIMKNIFNLRK